MGIGAYPGDQHVLGPVVGLCGGCVEPIRRDEGSVVGIASGDKAYHWHPACWRAAIEETKE